VHGMRLGLQRVRDMLAHLGDPHLGRTTVHVAGTNGKGSVCTMTSAALVAAGHRVGTFLSPHLVHVNERIRIDGAPIDDAQLDEVLCAVADARRAWGASRGEDEAPLTYFELSMITAFEVFRRVGVDVQVIEVGIGGRLDATNVVQPTVCAITSVGLDHVEVLGPDLVSIASEKAGILKTGVPAVVGPLVEEAFEVVASRASAVGAPLWRVGEEIRVQERRVSTPRGAVDDLSPGMAGPHQRDNAAVVVGVLHRLREAGCPVDDAAIRTGVRAVLAGRMSWLAPDLLADGAHNVDGARALGRHLAERGGASRRVLVFGCGEDRAPEALLEPLRAHVSAVITTAADHPRARDADALAARLHASGWPARRGGSPGEAIALARTLGSEVVVAGSLYLLGGVMAALEDGRAEADGS